MDSEQSQEHKILIAKRGSIKEQITRFSNFLAGFHDNKRSITELKVPLEKIEKLAVEFDQIQTEIEMLDNLETNERDIFEDNYYAHVGKAKDFLQNINQIPGAQPNVKNYFAKLPAIPLPTFSGDYRDWPRFQNSFTDLVNKDMNLSDAQRFHYLIESLGEAKQIIESIEITDTNYKTAFELLKQRYDNKKLIKKAHVASLFDIAPLAKKSFTGLRYKSLNEVNVHIRALKNLGESHIFQA
uniref:Uncharacterized protein n=1 Tax=Anoplophora glabripennis TaxID=217634 RepID=V5GP76_ANOGL